MYFVILTCLTMFFFFFFNDTATTEIYTLSLHDALPIYLAGRDEHRQLSGCAEVGLGGEQGQRGERRLARLGERSEEHTSELQSQSNLVCRLLLEKKKKRHKIIDHYYVYYSVTHITQRPL